MPQQIESLEQAYPHDNFSERAILGALLIDNKLIDRVKSRITADDFYRDSHILIYNAIQYVLDQGHTADVITVANRLTDKNELKFVGGYEFLSSLIDGVPENINLDSYLSIIVEKSTLRKSLKLVSRFVGDMMGARQDPEAILQLSNELGQLHDTQTTTCDIKDRIGPAVQLIEKIQTGKYQSVVPTGFRDIDEVMGGYPKGETTIIAARPGVGKSSFLISSMLEIACHSKDNKCLFFSLEMNDFKINARILSQVSGVKYKPLILGYPSLTSKEWSKIEEAATTIQGLNIIYDFNTTDIDRICSMARSKYREGVVDIIFLDYIGKCTLSGDQKKYYNRTQDVSYFSGQLSKLAKDLNVPVISLVQLNRTVDSRESKTPSNFYRLSDLKESGSLEQDAACVCFIHRETEPEAGDITSAQFIMKKTRDARTGQARLKFIPELAMFVPDLPKF